FSGVVGIREINLGQYLAGGAAVVPLQAVRPVYVDFTVPQQDVGLLQRGAEVHAKADTIDEVGKISAFDSVVDEATRNIRVRSTFDNHSGKLRPGMFAEAQLAKGGRIQVVTVPTSAISYAPFGDSVFIVEDVKDPKSGKSYRGVRQQFVKLG